MKKDYRILAMMEGRGFDLFEAEANAMQMQADKAGTEAPESNLLSMIEGAAVVEIKGKLVNTNSWYNSYFGLVSYDAIREAIIEAVDMGAGSILFDIDSPGGSVSGMKDLSSFIQTLDIPTISHTSSTAASAGYFLAISAEKTYMDSMAETGSVGVVMTLMEYTEAMKKSGVHAEVFRSGKHKQAGNPYEKLTAENRNHMKSQVMTYANKFYEFVSEQRGIPLPAMTEIKTGKTFIGEEALAAGLVDKIMSFDEALAEAVVLAEKTLDTNNKNSNYSNSYQFTNSASAQGETDMAKKFSKGHLAALVKAGKETPAPDATDATNSIDNSEEKLIPDTEENITKAEGSDDEPSTDANTPEMVEASELVSMTEKYDAAQIELVTINATVEDLTASLEAVKTENAAAVKPLVEVICAQISTMRIALSLTKVDMTEWSAESIMKEFNSVVKTFESSLPTGGVIPNEAADKDKKIETRDDVNAFKSLGF